MSEAPNLSFLKSNLARLLKRCIYALSEMFEFKYCQMMGQQLPKAYLAHKWLPGHRIRTPLSFLSAPVSNCIRLLLLLHRARILHQLEKKRGVRAL